MKNPHFEVVKCLKNDFRKVGRFISRFNDDNVIHLKASAKFLFWKYEASSFINKKAGLWIAKDREKIIGMFGGFPVRLFTPQGIVKAIWAADAIIEKNYRKYPFLFMDLTWRNKWESIGRTTVAALTFPRTKELSESWQKFADWLLIPGLSSFIFRITKNYIFNRRFSSVKFKKITRFGEEANYLFKKVVHQHDFIICRDKDYLNWRYFLHPFNKYTVINAYKGNEILGYIVIREDKEAKVGYIIDILGDLDYSASIYFLILESLRYFRENKFYFINCLLSHPKYKEIFRKIGFLPHRKEQCLAKFQDIELKKEFLKSKNWHITMGDGDFRGGK